MECLMRYIGPENATGFPDFFVHQESNPCPELSFDESRFKESGPVSVYERVEDAAFDKIGPLLTAAPTVKFDTTTGRLKMEMKGMTPRISQECKVTVKDSDGTEKALRMLFSNGTGTPVSESELNLRYNTGYTITSIIELCPPRRLPLLLRRCRML
ncbi:hypothetical protein BLNAU_22762 [Blattamonas nauphoetae]|uniref:Uncharacterized protein n=1 Tax=Blattamonas nauphoetae TaxID=2049346 RepID=A0ABQ9WS68_9EUKA|nr:hypothetical protein BLNAU_22762 [Blattamonas nauphoetae]